MKRALTIMIGILCAILTTSADLRSKENLAFDQANHEMRNIKTVNDVLDTYITNEDRVNIERIKVYTLERTSKYAILLMIEFHEELSMEKLEIMKQNSPKRWELFQGYMNKALSWLSLSKKAENFLGGNTLKALKKELGET